MPGFVTATKEQQEHGVRLHLLGTLDHEPIWHLRLYMMTESHDTGANHIMDVMHHVINDKAKL